MESQRDHKTKPLQLQIKAITCFSVIPLTVLVWFRLGLLQAWINLGMFPDFPDLQGTEKRSIVVLKSVNLVTVTKIPHSKLQKGAEAKYTFCAVGRESKKLPIKTLFHSFSSVCQTQRALLHREQSGEPRTGGKLKSMTQSIPKRSRSTNLFCCSTPFPLPGQIA